MVGTVHSGDGESYSMFTEHKSSRSSLYNADKASMYSPTSYEARGNNY